MNIKKITISIFAIAALVLSLLYVTDNSTSIENELITVRVGSMPIAHCAILSESDIFKKHGLNIVLSSSKGGALLSTALLQGGLDITFSNTVTPILAFQNGHSMISLGPATIESTDHIEHSLLVSQESNIVTPKDLEGKTIAINTLNNIDHLMLINFLQEHNVDKELVSFIEVPFPFMANSVQNGSADVIAVVEPFLTKSIQSGMKSVGNYFVSDAVDRTVVSSFYSTQTWLDKNPETAKKFKQALAEIVEKYKSDEGYAKALVAEYTKMDMLTLDSMTMPSYIDNITPSDMQYLIDMSTKHGFIKEQNQKELSRLNSLIE
ncbi:ABC transporter substrate-binding protein [Pseudoalteromonas sp. T1lg23B]|uniref:ABC transporter substrate-binding protein n=1 Tax=Pseudoalteromonas sp. T1lg23B TaxID=2077097 RepID=UPI000CF6974B|nr:ABC transporter substrate-binding protein [Pseudoalteromonas sp. T1lg23B]